MTAKVPISETGTATLGMSVARGLRRKKKTTSTTRMTDPMSVVSTLWTEARMVVVRSMHDRGLNALRQHRFKKRQLRLDAIDGFDDVGAGLAEDDEKDTSLAIHVAGGANILRGVDNVGDVGEPNRRAVVIADDQRLVFVPLRRSGRW